MPLKLSSQENVSVSELILTCKSWNIQKLHQFFFLEDEVTSILSIPLGVNPIEDRLMWHYTENGNFTIKSGYWLAHNIIMTASSSNQQAMKSWWKHFWSLQIPWKIKVFI